MARAFVFIMFRKQLIGAESGRLLWERTARKTQQAARKRGLRLTVCPRKAPARSGNQSVRTNYASQISTNTFVCSRPGPTEKVAI